MAEKSGAGRDGREDEGGCLENNCGSDVTGGSNPSPSANRPFFLFQNAFFGLDFAALKIKATFHKT
jgi:hypothetical protein